MDRMELLPSIEEEPERCSRYSSRASAAALGTETTGSSSLVTSRPERPARFPHLDGGRAAVALWIVCHHMAPRDPPSVLDAFTMRVDVGVEFFVLLSGFLTQYQYGDKEPPSSAKGMARFYLRRLGRTLMVTHIAMVSCVFLAWCGGFDVLNWRTAQCLLFVKTWLDPMPNCPNMPTWFVAAMLPSWLAYPFLLQPILERGQGSSCLLGSMLVAFWLLAIGPQLLLMALGRSWLTWDQILATWFWPPAQMADFAMGACTAALVRKMPPPKWAGFLGDVAIIVVMLACLLAPVPTTPDGWTGPAKWRPGHYMQWDQLSGRVSAPFIVAFLYGSSGTGSMLARLLSHRTLVALGAYTLEVYLFQMPLHDVFLWLRAPGGSFWRGLPWTNEVFLFYLLLLWILSGIFAEFVAQPFADNLRKVTGGEGPRVPPHQWQPDPDFTPPRAERMPLTKGTL